jgi:hypothetical protein
LEFRIADTFTASLGRLTAEDRRQADRLLSPELSDVDGNAESRRGTISAFQGAEPEVQVLPSVEDEATADEANLEDIYATERSTSGRTDGPGSEASRWLEGSASPSFPRTW